MKEIIEYIMNNYTWFLGGLIIILLAIIGRYADKTNFGQPKIKKQEENLNPVNSLDGKLLSDLTNKENINQNESKVQNAEPQQKLETIGQNIEPQQKLENLDQNFESLYDQQSENEGTSIVKEETQVIKEESLSEDKFEDFDKEFNEILPEKSLLDEELLDDIENIKIDKPQKMDIDVDLNLEDVELPKIKTFEPESNDVWKF